MLCDEPISRRAPFDYSRPQQSGAERPAAMIALAHEAAKEFHAHWSGLMPWQINLALAALMKWNAER